ncbi:hypothetical protein H4R26_001447 [Coemansia thaxteri]|uniref:Inner centromere protein ARK-binding domain-containing protein n=1 Tax=Coemansia thaxteri TaxID=2663907 RepID=A0A9W8BG00_9FUNG|nr:hypothetical protein H4R26_001447 [Coemansia thaxteri]KAJ2486754.1 hypothetical protein EV174_000914 [Coemansia sp. RSA 2320]
MAASSATRPQLYPAASARSLSSVSTTSTATTGGGGSWVGGRKRDWDNAFQSKHQEFEATLQENDRWLALYWQSIAGVKDTKRPNVAITEALKASSARRRGRTRMDVRDVFNISSGGSLGLSPVGSRFNTASSLNVALAQMAMMPPRSPFLGGEGLVSPRSQDSTLTRAEAAAVVRSHSTAAKTAAAVKRLQAMAASEPKELNEPKGPSEPKEPKELKELVPVEPPVARPPGMRLTPSAPVPTLRDMLLSRHRQSPPPPPPMLSRLQTLSSASSRASSPEPSPAEPSPAEPPAEELTRSEEDVRERLQRVRIALGRRSHDAMQRIDGIAAALSPDASDAELSALCRDIDEVAGMLPPSASEASSDDADVDTSEGEERPAGADANGDAPVPKLAPGLPGKRKHSDDDKPPAAQPQQLLPPPSRLAHPASGSLSRGRGRGRARPAPYTTGIPRSAGAGAVRAQASSSSVGSQDDAQRPAAAAGGPPRVGVPAGPGRVAEARRRFEHGPAPAPTFASPVAAMRPGYASIVAPRAAAARPPVAAVREAARRAEAVRINAAASRRPPQPRAANEPLFKSVAPKAPASAAGVRAPRPAPLSVGAGSSAIPVPVPQPPRPRAAAGADSDASKSSSSAASDSSRWGLTSMLSILSPASWKAQPEPPSQPAAQEPQTPAAGPHQRKIASPYDVQSPQTPYQPRPEHAGSRAQLVMPSYQDMAVPLRKSSARMSSSLMRAKDPSTHPRDSQIQRLINVQEGGRLSGVSSFRSSFFSDDEIAGAAATAAGSSSSRGPPAPLSRTKSTPDLPQAAQLDMVTPVKSLRRKSSVRSAASAEDEYTTIVPPGETSPPEIESDYSDEYSDDEFSPSGPPRRKKNDFRIPNWATTPELARGLEKQEKINPDRIFGRVKPLRISEVFNRPAEPNEHRRKPRNSSMIWHSKDALTSEEELSYIRLMGYDP